MEFLDVDQGNLMNAFDDGLDKFLDIESNFTDSNFNADIESNFNADNFNPSELWSHADMELTDMLDVDSGGSLEGGGGVCPITSDAPLNEFDQLWDPSDSGSSDSGIDCHSLKQEPLSPSSSSNGSDFSADSVMDFTPGVDMLLGPDLDFSILSPKAEGPDTPPLTPEKPSFPGCTISSLQQQQVVTSIIDIDSSTQTNPQQVIYTTTSNRPPNTSNGGLKVVFPAGQQQVTTVVPSSSVIQNLNTVLDLESNTLLNGNPALTQVLKSKIKIQPKPIMATGISSSSTTTTGSSNGTAGTVKVIQHGKTGPTNSKPIVLTQEEFAKLTAQGVLKFQPPTTVVKTEVPSPATMPAPTPTQTHTSRAFPITDLDCKLVKRQQRMIKNRESACLSRKRKKEYLSTLEERLEQFNNENEKLKQENHVLKKKVGALEEENQQLKNSSGLHFLTNKRAATLLLGCMFLFSLNIVPLSSLMNRPISPDLPSLQPAAYVAHSNGRHLLSTAELELPPLDIADTHTDLHLAREGLAKKSSERTLNSSDAELERTLNGLRETLKRQQQGLGGSGVGSGAAGAGGMSSQELMMGLRSMCPTYLNSTESQRLMSELQGWILEYSESRPQSTLFHNNPQQQPTAEHQQQQDEQKQRRRKKYQTPRRMKAALKYPGVNDARLPTLSRFAGPSHYSSDETVGGGEKYEVQLFSGADRTFQSLLSSIHRRNDTFYIVSFNRDHLLLPATTSPNKTSDAGLRPRMSLLMPAPGSNQTGGQEGDEASIAMMQIDCEVTATKLLHIRESAVPEHMKEGAGGSKREEASSKREEAGSKREEAGSKREEAGSKRETERKQEEFERKREATGSRWEELVRNREELERKRKEVERNNGTQSGEWKRNEGSK